MKNNVTGFCHILNWLSNFCHIILSHVTFLYRYMTKFCHILNQLTILSLYKQPKMSILYLILHIYA